MRSTDGLTSGCATYVGMGIATGLITSTRATVLANAVFDPLKEMESSISAEPDSIAVALTA